MNDSDAQILIMDFDNHCIVCHETNSTNNKLCYLTHLVKRKKCSCDPLIHSSCLEQWFARNRKCIICNSPIENCNPRTTQPVNYHVILCYIGIIVFMVSVILFILYECSLYA